MVDFIEHSYFQTVNWYVNILVLSKTIPVKAIFVIFLQTETTFLADIFIKSLSPGQKSKSL